MIKDALIAVQDSLSNIPGLRYVGEDWGQLDTYIKQPPVQFPCALIDAEGADYTNNGQKVQQAEGGITIRIAFQRLVNQSAKSPDPHKPFQVMDLLQEVYTALHGKEGETFGRLYRKRLRRVRRDDGIREFEMYFVFSLTDHQAKTNTRTIQLPPEISFGD